MKLSHEKQNMHSNHEEHSHHAHMLEDFKKRFIVSLIITIPVIFLSPFFYNLLKVEKFINFKYEQYLLLFLSAIVFVYGGQPFLKGLKDELKRRNPGMMTLIGVAISVSFLYSTLVTLGIQGKTFFWELVTLIDIMLLGHWIEMKSVLGASKALRKLGELIPSSAHKIMPNGKISNVSVADLMVNDEVLVKPGERIPADGVVISGQTSVNESMLTGESKLIVKRKISKVIGGSINGDGSINVKIKKTGEDSFVSQVIKLVKQAQESKSKTQNLTDKAAKWLTIIAIIAGTLTFAGWMIFSDVDTAFALERAATVLVIACPHALGLAIPLVTAFSTTLGAKNGILIRDRTAFENARNIDTIILDKTGTLTKGTFAVSEVIALVENITKQEILEFAAAVESHSQHPIAKAISQKSTDIKKIKNFKAIPGKGAQGTVDGKEVKTVSLEYLKDKNIKIKNEKIEPLYKQGQTIVFILVDNELKGAIGLSDVLRNESKQAIQSLKKLGIQTLMLTGDNEEAAKLVAQKVKIDKFEANVRPRDKAEIVKKIQHEKNKVNRRQIVAMVGDGINDAPSLAQADVGIAIGAGTDIAVETADIILVKSNLFDIVNLIKLAKSTYTKMLQNLFWATGYNLLAIPLAAGILSNFILSPAVGALLMSLSTVIVAVNATLLKS